jgi:hypothetical protein
MHVSFHLGCTAGAKIWQRGLGGQPADDLAARRRLNPQAGRPALHERLGGRPPWRRFYAFGESGRLGGWGKSARGLALQDAGARVGSRIRPGAGWRMDMAAPEDGRAPRIRKNPTLPICGKANPPSPSTFAGSYGGQEATEDR